MPGFGLSLEEMSSAGLRQRPLSGQLRRDALLLAVAGRPFRRTAGAFIKLSRARDWGVQLRTGAAWLAVPSCSGEP